MNVVKKILSKAPPQDGDLVSQGKDFLLKGEFADAIGFLKKAIEANPADDKTYSLQRLCGPFKGQHKAV